MNVSFVKGVSVFCLCAYLMVSDCPMHGQDIEDPSEFGLLGQGTVTSVAASGVSQSIVRTIDLTPINGPIVPYQMELNHKGQLMENEKELS